MEVQLVIRISELVTKDYQTIFKQIDLEIIVFPMKATFNTLTNVKFTSLLAYHIAGLAEIESSRWTPIEASLQALEQLRRVLHELGAVLGASNENEGVIDQLRRLLQLQPRLHIFPSLLLLLLRRQWPIPIWRMHLH